MADLKTKPTGDDVEGFLNGIGAEQKRLDGFRLLDIMRRATKVEPVLWSGNMIGFGHHHYKYPSGHEGETFRVGFSPRKQYLTLYLLSGFEHQEALLAKLGKHKTGKGCLYIRRLDDVHLPTLRKLIQQSLKHNARKQGGRHEG